MSLGLRFFLVVGAVLAFVAVAHKIRKTDMQADDSVFWLILGGCLVIIAVFPKIVFGASEFLGFESPSNFVLLLVIAVLMVKVLSLSSELACLRQRLTALIQELALKDAD